MHDRLVEDEELVALQRAFEVDLEGEPGQRRGMHARFEDLDSVLAVALGHVHRHVGVAQQLVRGLVVAGRDGDADAGVDEQLLAAMLERRLEGGQQAFGDVERAGRVGRVLDQHRELVAAHPGDRVTGSQRAAQPLRHPDEQLIAVAVPEAVVDVLEVVEVDEQDGQRVAPPPRPGERVVEPVGEQGAIGQTRERVVEGLVPEFVLERLAGGDVAVVDDQAGDRRVVEEVLADRLDRPPRAVRVTDAELPGGLRAGRHDDVAEQLLGPFPVVGVDELEGGPALALLGPEPEHPLDRGALVFDRGIGAQDHVDVGRVLDERTEALLAAPQIGGQDEFGDGLLLQAPVLVGQQARGGREPEEQEDEQDGGHHPDDDQDVLAGPGDVGLDRRGVLVDLVGAHDGVGSRLADGQVDRQESGGHTLLEQVLLVVAVGEFGRRLAIEGLLEVLLDVEPAPAQGRQVGEHDRAVGRPDLDPQDLAGGRETGQFVVDGGAVGACRIGHRSLGDRPVDIPADDRFGGPHGLADGRRAQVVGHGHRHDDGRPDDERTRHGQDQRPESGTPAGRDRETVHGARCSDPRDTAGMRSPVRGTVGRAARYDY